ncbi:DUF1697 domain-containing protein [Halobacillus campisalis]|uniref:DUF1697 domain-containing protein n=1 Tax=Halobacillus campisalis TaxID=435909 RepID=A0ABW2K6Y0_9BACI|nr:DUF1697 domain-containing protein [Halobacillus campisalis]
MKYAALLRGINVGGKNKMDMKLLRQTFEKAGMTSVVSYINTGNIIFDDDEHSRTELTHSIEKAIETDFGLEIKVVVRSMEDFQRLMENLPDSWKNDQEMKSDVLFLWDDIDADSILEELDIKEGIDHVIYVSGAVLWSINRKNINKSGMKRLAGSSLYKRMTIRNVNTTRKIYERMQEE